MWKCNWTTYAFQKFQTLTFAHFFSPLKLEKVFSPAFLPFLFVFLSTSVANATPAICKLVQKKVSRKSVSLNQTRSKLFKRGIKEKETKIFLVPLHTQSGRLRQNQVKFRYCEKATKFEETSHLFFILLRIRENWEILKKKF